MHARLPDGLFLVTTKNRQPSTGASLDWTIRGGSLDIIIIVLDLAVALTLSLPASTVLTPTHKTAKINQTF